MNWGDFLMGAMTVVIAYAFLSMGLETEDGFEEAAPTQEQENVVVNDFTRKRVVLYCEDCRKKQNHKVVQPNLYKCNKCQRATDLRVS